MSTLKRFDDNKVHQVLKDDFKLTKYKKDDREMTTRFKLPRFDNSYYPEQTDKLSVVLDSYNGRPYVVRAEQFLSQEEINVINSEQ